MKYIKSNTTLLMDIKLREEARRMKINMSQTVNRLLAEELARMGSEYAKKYLEDEIQEMEHLIKTKKRAIEGD